MVHSSVRNLCPRSFNPRVVSIGPLHREDENVQAFEGQKATYLNRLLHRLKSPQEEKDSIHEIQACYAGIKIYGDVEFAKMMVMDACFILEFIQRNLKSDESISRKMLLAQSVIYDLVLLENQIPFFVLDDIFRCTFLKLYPDSTLIDSTIHSAVELDRAGVNFKPNRDAKSPMAIDVKLHSFPCFPWPRGKPTLRMPVLRVHHFTELVLRNLMAYEMCYRGCNYITSYAISMDMLVDTQEDIAKLVEKKVLVNNMGSNEAAADMINNICKQVVRVNFGCDEEWKELDNYCKGYWPKNMVWLKRTYFSSPWNIVALVAGTVLFVLTVVQTFFTIKPAGSTD
ncbi:hypothetical protein L6452_02468 [Arctium lappa]|uniref:Uncharacterized protein n=1 Tax=Arctium lappa TaxID=4217 RepID=A0ACB9FJZ9_ARCLA|nr:hypothetical protein L6452_02468 [Arctium lappa]